MSDVRIIKAALLGAGTVGSGVFKKGNYDMRIKQVKNEGTEK